MSSLTLTIFNFILSNTSKNWNWFNLREYFCIKKQDTKTDYTNNKIINQNWLNNWVLVALLNYYIWERNTKSIVIHYKFY